MPKIALTLLMAGVAAVALSAHAETRTGKAAFGDWTTDAPGVRRLITANDLPGLRASEPASNPSQIVARMPGASPEVPAGFEVQQFAGGLRNPRMIRIAPNGDIFVAETGAGRIHVIRAADGAAKPSEEATFVSGLNAPFGIAFYPEGPNPEFIYIANTNSVVRFPYKNGDLKVSGVAQTIVPKLPTGGHSTRDIRFSPDGTKLFISVGSASNVAEGVDPLKPAEIKAFEAKKGLGAMWDEEENRADVLVTSPDGKAGLKPFATGIRNCVTMNVQPVTNDLWCVTNERDIWGDDLPPDYATRVREGGFYGWPWYYIGGHEDPLHLKERPDLAGKVTVPDVLFQPHSAPLGMAFYTGSQFPAEYKGDAFVTLHGSWNRAKRTGYKLVRLILKDGKPTGEYEDFMVGMVTNADPNVWARPVGVAVAHDGSLLVTEDGNGTIWRITYKGS